MKAGFKFGLTLVAVAALASISMAAQKVTGSWKGHIKIDASKMKAPSGGGGQGGRAGGGGGGFDPAKMAERMAKMSIQLTINANKTYVRVMKGGPRGDMSQKGTWTQKGNEITLTPTPEADPHADRPKAPGSGGGGGRGAGRPMVLKITGKTLTGTMMRGAATITFSR